MRTRLALIIGVLSLTVPFGLAGDAQAAFPGHNGRIAFEEFISFASSYDINSLDPSGANPKFLATSSSQETDAAYSANGMRIVFERLDSSFTGDIWRMRANGTGQRQLTHGGADDKDPTFSPNGKRIAFIRNGDLWVMHPDGAHKDKIKNLNDGQNPSWSPNGKWIAYDSGAFLHHDIHVVRADGTHDRALTHSPDLRNKSPDWSPNGRRIVFSRVVGPDSDIYVMRPDGSHKHSILATSNDEFNPAFSPDGKQVAYNSSGTSSGYQNIFRLTLATHTEHELSFDSHNEYSPTWQPQ